MGSDSCPYTSPQNERPRLISARKFLAELKAPKPIIDGLPVQRGALVCVTGPTGHGKTTVCTAMQAAFRTGRSFAGREVVGGSVLVLAGENPDDYAMHLRATLLQMNVEPAELSDHGGKTHMMVMPGTFSIDLNVEWLHEQIALIPCELVAVFVDTSAAFYLEADENDNTAMRRHASMLRELCTLPGKPTVFVLCHPTKTATKDNLLPRGGGAFLAEVDANLTVWKSDDIVTLHWAGKIRGSNFDPIKFELVPQELPDHLDRHGRPLVSTTVRHVPDERAEQLEEKALDDENRLMVAMQRKPGGSIADLAKQAGMTLNMGTPNKNKVFRLLAKLQQQALVEKDRTNTWRLTGKGKKEADALP